MHGITKLEAENFKRLKAIQINPDGSPLVIVGGANGAGKSSTLDAIEAALGGQKRSPEKPIRDGEKKARIVVETDELIVTRTYTAKGSRLEVRPKGEDGAVIASPQKILDSLVGALSFDPLEFGRLEPKRQAKVLRDLVGLDLESLDVARSKYEMERRDVGRDLKRAQGALDKMGADPAAQEPGMTAAEILAEIKARRERNDDRNSQRSKLGTMRARAQSIIDERRAINDRIADLEKALKSAGEEIDELTNELEEIRGSGKELAATVETLPPDEPIDDLEAELANAERNAASAADAVRRSALVEETKELEGRYGALTANIEQVDRTRDAAIENAAYPIAGLEAHDDGVYLAGVPWSQASSAEALRASVAIGLALNPKLRILLIRDGSLLDEKSLAMISTMAAEADAQLWIERVGAGDEVSVVIEDGAIAG